MKTLNFNISDHMAVVVVRKKHKVTVNKVRFEGRSYKNYIKEDFQNNLINSDWTQFYREK